MKGSAGGQVRVGKLRAGKNSDKKSELVKVLRRKVRKGEREDKENERGRR